MSGDCWSQASPEELAMVDALEHGGAELVSDDELEAAVDRQAGLLAAADHAIESYHATARWRLLRRRRCLRAHREAVAAMVPFELQLVRVLAEDGVDPRAAVEPAAA